MKKPIITVLFILVLSRNYSTDFIHDDYRETNTSVFHSRGLFSYGLHSNTFHLRNFFLRYNLNIFDLQFFATLNGYKDTHSPETNYGFILNNINLYDYGATFRFFDLGFLSFRGAAVYKQNTETFLIIPHYTVTNNPAEFDSPVQYLPEFFNAAGVRIGFIRQNFEIAYSQADFRHNIPISAILKYSMDGLYLRGLFQLYYKNPLVFISTNIGMMGQLSAGGEVQIGDFKINSVLDINYGNNNRFWMRLEEALTYQDYTLGIRQFFMNYAAGLYEISIKKNFYRTASIGIFAASDKRAYLAMEVDF